MAQDSKMRRLGRASLALLALLAAGAPVEFAGDLLDQFRRPPLGNYKALHRSLEGVERATGEALEQSRNRGNVIAARALERAIRYSRASAQRSGTRPIPDEIRRDLEDFFSPDLLDDVRWTPAGRRVNLGSLVGAWYREHGGAVTLDDTIIYSRSELARNRLLWAHELTHALQYEELGVRGFAEAYVLNYRYLERQARENARRIIVEIRQREAE